MYKTYIHTPILACFSPKFKDSRVRADATRVTHRDGPGHPGSQPCNRVDRVPCEEAVGPRPRLVVPQIIELDLSWYVETERVLQQCCGTLRDTAMPSTTPLGHRLYLRAFSHAETVVQDV